MLYEASTTLPETHMAGIPTLTALDSGRLTGEGVATVSMPSDGAGSSQPCFRFDAQWRRRPSVSSSTGSGIQVSRYKEERPELRNGSTSCEADCVSIDIALRYTELALWVEDECVFRGGLQPGTVIGTGAGLTARAEFRGPCDVLHLFVPTALYVDLSLKAGIGSARSLPHVIPPVRDKTIEALAWSLLRVEELDSASAELYVDAVTMAILVRLLARVLACNLPSGRRGNQTRGGLVMWRLQRVLKFVEANLAEPLSLEALAACAGLSRMYFAAQFKAATGIRPHEYLIRRRVERAATILQETTMPLVEVAHEVGFQTQAHFTTVFRRFTCETPSRWRQYCREKPVAGGGRARQPPAARNAFAVLPVQ